MIKPSRWTLTVSGDPLAAHIGATAKSALEAAKAAASYADDGEVVTVSADHLKNPKRFVVTRLGVIEVTSTL